MTKLFIHISMEGVVPVGNVEYAQREFDADPKAFVEWLLDHGEYLTIRADISGELDKGPSPRV